MAHVTALFNITAKMNDLPPCLILIAITKNSNTTTGDIAVNTTTTSITTTVGVDDCFSCVLTTASDCEVWKYSQVQLCTWVSITQPIKQ